MLFLHVTATTVFARHYGRLMAERGRGAILLVSSVLGLAAGPYFVGYAATKSYVATLGETLSAEMAPLGVHVSVLSSAGGAHLARVAHANPCSPTRVCAT